MLALLWLGGLWFEGNLAWPVVLAAIGFAVLWARGDGERGRWNLESLGTPLSFTRFVIGALLILAGMAVFLAGRTSLESVGNVLVGMIVAIGGAALLAGPWIWAMGRQLVEERSSRVRSEERAEMAAHLHDSVLQTLALIQRAKSTREMTSLARTQERELRAWLYGRAPELAGVRLRDAVDSMAGRIERQHQVSVEAVVVGDAEMDERLRGPRQRLRRGGRQRRRPLRQHRHQRVRRGRAGRRSPPSCATRARDSIPPSSPPIGAGSPTRSSAAWSAMAAPRPCTAGPGRAQRSS